MEESGWTAADRCQIQKLCRGGLSCGGADEHGESGGKERQIAYTAQLGMRRVFPYSKALVIEHLKLTSLTSYRNRSFQPTQ